MVVEDKNITIYNDTSVWVEFSPFIPENDSLSKMPLAHADIRCNIMFMQHQDCNSCELRKNIIKPTPNENNLSLDSPDNF